MKEIGEALGVTRQRVDQLINQYSIPRIPIGERRYQASVRGREEEIEHLFLSLRDDNAVADRVGVQPSVIRRFVDAHVPDSDVLRQAPRDRTQLYSDDELVGALRAAAEELSSPITTWAYG